jgi:hypothetical protein
MPAQTSTPALTIFAIPKPFRGHIDVIQRNAIASWTRLDPRPEILLLGDEDGTAAAARDLGVVHQSGGARNEVGTPLLDDFFARGERTAAAPVLAYVNADIMLTADFLVAIERVRAAFRKFLMVGRRWDLNLDAPWDFGAAGWQQDLTERARCANVLRPPTFIDYFVFTRGSTEGLLPLAIGRGFWDNYLVWRAHSGGAAVVDATQVVTAVHQNHDYAHNVTGASTGVANTGVVNTWTGSESTRNREMVGGWWHRYTIEDATHRLTPAGLERSHLHAWLMVRRLWSHPLTIFTWPWSALRRAPRARHDVRTRTNAE